jgi:hydroxymethylpyrimidine/phosphomethylpyrimidine kinase
LIGSLKKNFPSVKIIWDPILKASAGFQFHHEVDENLLHEILSQLFLITPNHEEAKQLMKEDDAFIAAKMMSRFCKVFLKSWQDESQNHFDLLFENSEEIRLKSEFIEGITKHGSGCVLSAAITANLSKGMDLKSACEEAKAYTLEFLKSHDGLLGEHHKIKLPQHA